MVYKNTFTSSCFISFFHYNLFVAASLGPLQSHKVSKLDYSYLYKYCVSQQQSMLQEDKTPHVRKHTSVICLTRYYQVCNLSDTQPCEPCMEPIIGAGKKEVYAPKKVYKKQECWSWMTERALPPENYLDFKVTI